MSKRTDAIRTLFAQTSAPELSADNPPARSAEPRVSAGAVNSIRNTFSEIERENEALRAAAAGHERVSEIDAGLIDPSPFADRFVGEDDESFAVLRASMAERGQEVPVLLRPHPAHKARYQTAYGHRRVRAARELGLTVRAIIRALSDDELAAAQGVENSARQDLTFIERAVFAARLEDAGRARSVIQHALSIDKAETSKLIAVARAIPLPLIGAIGRAPRAGRGRWQELAIRLGNPQALARVNAAMAKGDFAKSNSDARFVSVLALAQRSPEARAMDAPQRLVIRNQAGETIAKVSDADGQCRVIIDRMKHAGFADFVTGEIAALYERYTQYGGSGRR